MRRTGRTLARVLLPLAAGLPAMAEDRAALPEGLDAAGTRVPGPTDPATMGDHAVRLGVLRGDGGTIRQVGCG